MLREPQCWNTACCRWTGWFPVWKCLHPSASANLSCNHQGVDSATQLRNGYESSNMSSWHPLWCISGKRRSQTNTWLTRRSSLKGTPPTVRLSSCMPFFSVNRSPLTAIFITASRSILMTRLRPCSSTEICDKQTPVSWSARTWQLVTILKARSDLPPLPVIDNGPAAGDSADRAVLQLQLQPPTMHCYHNPGAVQVTACKEDHPLSIEGAEVKLCWKANKKRGICMKEKKSQVNFIYQALFKNSRGWPKKDKRSKSEKTMQKRRKWKTVLPFLLRICRTDPHKNIYPTFSPGMNPATKTKANHRHAAEHAAQIERTRVSLWGLHHAASYILKKK